MGRRARTGVAAAVLAAGVMACGGDATSPGAGEQALSRIVAEYLTIDLGNPPNYASPAWPVHYDADVLRRMNTPARSAIDDRIATVGRVLFFDRSLSINRGIACASCHVQELGFTDSSVQSFGFRGIEATAAHSMRLANAVFYEPEEMFWDRRAADLEDQALQPVVDPIEMGFTPAAGGLPAMIARLDSLEYYPALFEWAWGSGEITESRLRIALGQYIRSIVSVGSRFDTGFAQRHAEGGNGPIPGLTEQENRGFDLWRTRPDEGGAGCGRCHLVPTFALIDNSGSNGLDLDERTQFKAPSLKNIAATGPYMHDGRFGTLTEVVEHYNSGIQPAPSLDVRLIGERGSGLKLNLTEAEVAALVAFMETLTDDALLSDPKFANPFIR